VSARRRVNHQIVVGLDEHLLRRVDAWARHTGVPRSMAVRRILQEFLDAREPAPIILPTLIDVDAVWTARADDA